MNLLVFMHAHDRSSQSIMVDCAELEEMMNKGKSYYALLQIGGGR